MKKLLVVVDMQNDFITGVLGSKYAQDIIPNVTKKIQEYIDNEDLILFTVDSHQKDNYLNTREGKHLPVEHCIVGETGRDLTPEIFDILEGHTVVFSTNPFIDREENIRAIFKDTFGIVDFGNFQLFPSEIEIIGVATNLCVISNAVILQTICKNTEITIDASCCASYDPILHEKALDVMEGLQFNVINR